MTVVGPLHRKQPPQETEGIESWALFATLYLVIGLCAQLISFTQAKNKQELSLKLQQVIGRETVSGANDMYLGIIVLVEANNQLYAHGIEDGFSCI